MMVIMTLDAALEREVNKLISTQWRNQPGDKNRIGDRWAIVLTKENTCYNYSGVQKSLPYT